MHEMFAEETGDGKVKVTKMRKQRKPREQHIGEHDRNSSPNDRNVTYVA